LGAKVTLLASVWVSIGGVGTAHVAASFRTQAQEAEQMKISINSNAKAKQETASKDAGAYHGVRHRKKSSKVFHHLGKAKNGWIGAALLRGRVV
jgi:cell division ATPase FtsA